MNETTFYPVLFLTLGFSGFVVGTKGNRFRAFVAVVFGSIAPRTYEREASNSGV